MIDLSLIKVIPAEEYHCAFYYTVKKEAYGGYITRIWGWDEKKERDFQSLEDKMATIRERDSMSQIRVPIATLKTTLLAKLAGEDLLVLPEGGIRVEKKG